jgi:hypothetical protein
MRVLAVLFVALAASATSWFEAQPASAFDRNPEGCGLYTPAEPPVRGRPRIYRYDPRSWCYDWRRLDRRYYPYYGSGYWVPRAAMQYRYRYVYRGPKYTYYPAWGYGFPAWHYWW